MPYRLTFTINNISIHSRKSKGQPNYHSTRITVFLFGTKGNIIEDIKLLLILFTENEIGYEIGEWWFNETTSMDLSKCEFSDAKGLGFYKAEIVHEDNDGKETQRNVLDARNRTFGEQIY